MKKKQHVLQLGSLLLHWLRQGLAGIWGTFLFAVRDFKKMEPSTLRSRRDLDVGGSLLKNGAETWGKNRPGDVFDRSGDFGDFF